MKIKIGLAGTTKNSLQSIKSLLNNPKFELSWVITPSPKKIGRKQILTKNIVHEWALENHVPSVLVHEKIDAKLKTDLATMPVDIILVVDFGYFIPEWLINFPKLGCLNIHPSKLPRWRGSAPGQFCLLFGDKKSATSLIEVTNQLDAGPVINQVDFDVDPNWTNTNYYSYAFDLFLKNFDQVLLDYIQNKTATPQPHKSPTMIARRISKADSFIDWQTIASYKENPTDPKIDWQDSSELLVQVQKETNNSLPELIDRATKAFYGWPNLWTTIPTKKGVKRMKILSVIASNKDLKLETVQIEGQKPAMWNQVKNILKT